MSKLWEKTMQKKSHDTHPVIEKYIAGTDCIFDMELIPFDVLASKAHAKGLERIGIITTEELKKVFGGFDEFEKEFKEGRIRITPEDEDCHTVIENYLVKVKKEEIGDVGKKIHTGRSRNDQVLVALRLYMKAHLRKFLQESASLATLLLRFAKRHKNIPMPGYSHTKQAMLGSVGHHFSSYVESLLDDADFLSSVLKHIDKNPLGSAAGFGTSIPIDRGYTTKELGFAGIQVNSLYCQNSRGKFESLFLEGLVQVMLTLGRFANDLTLFTSEEFGFFRVSESVTTGSSIMPQKCNLDPAEVLRGNVSVVIANQLMIKEICKNLLSGYNRDLQLLKKPLMESVAIVHDSLKVAKLMVRGIAPRAKNIRAKITLGIFAADIANDLVKSKGVPFRDAYNQALGELKGQTVDMEKNLASKKTLGAPGNLQLGRLGRRVAKVTKSLRRNRPKIIRF